MGFWGGYVEWPRSKTVAERRADAARTINNAARRGKPLSPVAIDGRKIAQTFWGKAWCDNLERYRDFAHRLERGRSYVRSGSVIDLQITAGTATALVSGSELYEVSIEIDAVKADTWRAIRRDCAGSISSLVELLGGRLSEPVMARLCADRVGLFPPPSSIRFTCSCPDYAIMCKHVAAAMYGIGARFDRAPELLFGLRGVSADELIASAMHDLPVARTPAPARVLPAAGLAALFGIELASPTPKRAARGKLTKAKPAKAKKPSQPKRRATPRRAK